MENRYDLITQINAIIDNPFTVIIERLRAIEEKISVLLELNQKDYPKPDELLDIQQVANLINESVSSVYVRTSKRTIPFYKRGKRLIFKRSDIMEWIESGKKKTLKEIADSI